MAKPPPHDPCAIVLCSPGHTCHVGCNGEPTCQPVVCNGFAGWPCESGFICKEPDPSIPDLVGDREQLIQAVLNLARNALQAVEGRGRLLLRSRARRQVTLAGTTHRLVAVMEVEDSGPGVPPELQEKIFYPMVTTRAGGTGLGLPIAQQLAHSHGGLVECRSRPGCTVFSMSLPLERMA